MKIQLNIIQNKPKALILALVVSVLMLSWLNLLDNKTSQYVDDAIYEATVAFGIARGLNAVISTLQSATVEFSLGIGGSVSPGELLDPVNDLVEDFSTLMKISIISLAIQALLLEIFSDAFFKLFLSVITILFLISYSLQKDYLTRVFFKTFIFICFIRFSLVLVVLLSSMIDQTFIQEKIKTDLNTIEQTRSSLDTLNKQEEEGFFSGMNEMKNYLNSFQLQEIQKKLDLATNSIMQLMAHFLFKSMLLPLLFLALLLKGVKFIWGFDIESTFKLSIKPIKNHSH